MFEVKPGEISIRFEDGVGGQARITHYEQPKKRTMTIVAETISYGSSLYDIGLFLAAIGEELIAESRRKE